jgi:hypothetical protein
LCASSSAKTVIWCVRYETLRRHYGRWLRAGGEDQLELMVKLAPKRLMNREDPGIYGGKKCEEGDLNPHGLLAH